MVKMQSSLYVGLSGQIALAKRLETMAGNVANMSTVGYRAESINFKTVMAQAGTQQIAYLEPGDTYINRASGALTSTGNPFDVAVRGNGWFAVRTDAGIAYSRDGRSRIAENGQLQTLNGAPILDAGMAPISLTPGGSTPVISRDGMITQDGRQMGAIGLFSLPPDARLSRGPSGSVTSNVQATPVLDFVTNNVVQGFTEGSNTDPVKEMTDLIIVQRFFEMVSGSMESIDNTKTDAIKSLGS